MALLGIRDHSCWGPYGMHTCKRDCPVSEETTGVCRFLHAIAGPGGPNSVGSGFVQLPRSSRPKQNDSGTFLKSYKD